MSLSYRENYWDSLELKDEFIGFLLHIHGLDLSLWDKMGFWDQKYRPFSYFSGSSLVSNVCVYSMEMTIQGKQCLVAQISAVGTLPEYRRKGLSFKLNQKAINWARNNHDFFFLFADQDAYRFYKKCGFRRADEYKTSVSISGKVAQTGAVKLDIQRKDHIKQIFRFASDREPVSDVLGVSSKKLFMFWCLYSLRDHIYFIPELDVLVLYKRVNEVVTIFDIVGTNIPSLSKIYSYICGESDETIEFLFMVDKLNLGGCDQIRIEENGTHILGNFPLEGTQFIFPFTAHA
ncbi:MAG: GNAT family N-acetyltransferase [candidate division Zixibacteria bacterium]|nr:GNAT family N-acetyltransferase [candidate division Zixibacteria bacterium]